MYKNELEKALSLANETKLLKLGENVLDEIVQVFKSQFSDKKALVIADKNTYPVAGEAIHHYLSQAGLVYAAPLIIDDPKLYANYTFVQQIVPHLEPADVIAVAVGSGVINDLAKRASHEVGKPYMCVATAASMDGYSAYGASITKSGAKMTMECAAPRAILADLAVMCAAPPVSNASGYADLYAKVPAGADWIFADALGVESIDSQSWHTVQNGLAPSLQYPEGVKTGDISAIKPLTEGLMLAGFAMQSLQSSRPASGAEHQFSHLWDMEHHTFQGEMAKTYGLYKDRDEQAPSHGFKVGIGTLTVIALYERIFETPLDQLDVDQAVSQWKSLEEQIAEVNNLFVEEGPRAFAVKQVTDKYISKENLREQLNVLKSHWPEIREKLKKQLTSYGETKKRLERAGAPVACEQIGITRARLRESFYKAHKLRSRFTVLDVAYRVGYLDKWVDELFADDGVLAN